MNDISIENLSPEELIELHRKIYKRIRELQRGKILKELQGFEIGDDVSFKHESDIITGTVIRVNQKSLSVRTGKGNWYLDPRSATKLPAALSN